jgi:heme-degrading monooxygenase HmoA
MQLQSPGVPGRHVQGGQAMVGDPTIQRMVNHRPYVAVSEISVPEAGIAGLEHAFDQRLGAVDGWPGFQGMELLQDRRVPGRYLMMCRWDTREHFLAYMRSDDHRRSHARMPSGPDGPSPSGFSEYTRVAE